MRFQVRERVADRIAALRPRVLAFRSQRAAIAMAKLIMGTILPMAKNTVSSSLLIPAPARRVYAIIADYREGHPRILPRPPFVSLSVEEGGVGEGTVIRCEMRMLGRLQAFHASITEPEPGRMLVETISETDTVTTYVIEPRENGSHAYVTISTVTQVREGVPGRLEGWLTSRLLQPVYVKELHQLAAVAAEQVR